MSVMREMIQKAKKMAQSPDELLLPERLEEYLDLLDIQKTLSSPEERAELLPRLQASFLSLREAAELACVRQGVNFEELITKAEQEVAQVHLPREQKVSRSRLKNQGRTV